MYAVRSPIKYLIPTNNTVCLSVFLHYNLWKKLASLTDFSTIYRLFGIILLGRAVRRRRRRHFADAAAADHNWSARRRCRRRPNVAVAPAPFLWRVHVTLYTSYMLLDFCNAVYNESSTLTKSSKNNAGVFCNSPWYSIETQRRMSKSVFVDNFVKMKADAKSFV